MHDSFAWRRCGARTIQRTRLTVALLTSVLVMLGPVGASAASEVAFTQLNWLADDGSDLVPQSRVGVATFLFAAGEVQLLDANGGGWLNLTVEVPGETGPEWSVQNLHLSFPDPAVLADSRSSVQFDLGVINGTPVGAVNYLLSVTDTPQPNMPPGVLQPTGVDNRDYLVGGLDGGGSGGQELYLTVGPFVGCEFSTCGAPGERAGGEQAANSIPVVDEDKMGCAPAAVARALKKMFPGLPDSVQTIYEELAVRMGTNGTTGTTTDNAKRGKKAYIKAKKLKVRVSKSKFRNGVKKASDALKNMGAAELRIQFANGQGHMAMVDSITPQPGGGYKITYVDDPTQGDDNAENKSHEIIVDKKGKVTSPKGGGTVTHFIIETKK